MPKHRSSLNRKLARKIIRPAVGKSGTKPYRRDLRVGVGITLTVLKRVKEEGMTWARLSLYYVCCYLLVGGPTLLLFPAEGLRILLSNGNYADVMPRVVG